VIPEAFTVYGIHELYAGYAVIVKRDDGASTSTPAAACGHREEPDDE